MNKFEIMLSDEMIITLQKAKEIQEKRNGGLYISWDRFLRSCIIIQATSLIESDEK